MRAASMHPCRPAARSAPHSSLVTARMAVGATDAGRPFSAAWPWFARARPRNPTTRGVRRHRGHAGPEHVGLLVATGFITNDSPRPALACQPLTQSASVPKKLIVIAQSCDEVRLLYEECLRGAGIDVASVDNGVAAVDLTATARPAAVVVELDLPVMSGLDAIAAIRGMHFDERPFVVAVATPMSDELRSKAMASGADACLETPLSPNVLCKIVLDALAR